MNMNNLTIKAQEVIQNAFSIAGAKNNQAVENAHVLKALLNQDDNLFSFIIVKFGVNKQNFALGTDGLFRHYHKLQGVINIYQIVFQNH